MMSPSAMPTEGLPMPPLGGAPSSCTKKKAHPFTPVDNPTFTPCYDDPTLGPSPYSDWVEHSHGRSHDHLPATETVQVEHSHGRHHDHGPATETVPEPIALGGGYGVVSPREDPSDAPNLDQRRASPAAAADSQAASAAAKRGPPGGPSPGKEASSAPQEPREFDSLLLENNSNSNSNNGATSPESQRNPRRRSNSTANWMPTDLDNAADGGADDDQGQHHGHEVSPKKRRVERVIQYEDVSGLEEEVVDVDDELNSGMPASRAGRPLSLTMPLPRGYDEHGRQGQELLPEMQDVRDMHYWNDMYDMHGMHPDGHVAYGYHHEVDMSHGGPFPPGASMRPFSRSPFAYGRPPHSASRPPPRQHPRGAAHHRPHPQAHPSNRPRGRMVTVNGQRRVAHPNRMVMTGPSRGRNPHQQHAMAIERRRQMHMRMQMQMHHDLELTPNTSRSSSEAHFEEEEGFSNEQDSPSSEQRRGSFPSTMQTPPRAVPALGRSASLPQAYRNSFVTGMPHHPSHHTQMPPNGRLYSRGRPRHGYAPVPPTSQGGGGRHHHHHHQGFAPRRHSNNGGVTINPANLPSARARRAFQQMSVPPSAAPVSSPDVVALPNDIDAPYYFPDDGSDPFEGEHAFFGSDAAEVIDLEDTFFAECEPEPQIEANDDDDVVVVGGGSSNKKESHQQQRRAGGLDRGDALSIKNNDSDPESSPTSVMAMDLTFQGQLAAHDGNDHQEDRKPSAKKKGMLDAVKRNLRVPLNNSTEGNGNDMDMETWSDNDNGSTDSASKASSTTTASPSHNGKELQKQSSFALAVTQAQTEAYVDVPHFTMRQHLSLSVDEDENWLSRFQCYLRAEFMEIFRASDEDVKFRNTSRKVIFHQLGIRCRFCAHIHPNARARRSSAYPSSTAQIYQSFNMMIRDHFPKCESIPSEKMALFHDLKNRNNQGAADSKLYWRYAAGKLGMVDTEQGIKMDEETRQAAAMLPPFSTDDSGSSEASKSSPPVLLVRPEDNSSASPFLYELLSRVQRVNLLDCECRSTRKNLKVGLPGFGCRYCAQAGRMGFSRVFPTKRKGLPEKANDIYEHMCRCTLCPPEVKHTLRSLKPRPDSNGVMPSLGANDKAFLDRIWTRMNQNEQSL